VPSSFSRPFPVHYYFFFSLGPFSFIISLVFLLVFLFKVFVPFVFCVVSIFFVHVRVCMFWVLCVCSFGRRRQ
jgi:hypothetical protein